MFLSRIPDPTFFHPGSRTNFTIPDPGSASKNLSILTQKNHKWFLSSMKYDPGCSSRIPDPDPYFLPIPDPGSQIQGSKRHRILDPRSGSVPLNYRISFKGDVWKCTKGCLQWLRTARYIIINVGEIYVDVCCPNRLILDSLFENKIV